MSALGQAVVKLSLDKNNFDAGLYAAESSVKSLAKSAVFLGASFLGVTTVFDSLNKQIDVLAKLDDAAQKTGSAVETLSRLQKVAVMFGEDFNGKVEPAITKLARGLAGIEDPSNKAGAALKALGIEGRDSNGNLRDTSQIMIDVAKKLQEYQDGAGKAAIATDLFGKTGAELLPYLNDMAENIDDVSGASSKAAAEAAAFQDSLNKQKQQFDDYLQNITISVLTPLNDLLGAYQDTQKAGQDFSNDKSVAGWADNLAASIAPIYDTLVNLKNEVYAVGKSFQVVYADLQVGGARLKLLNPAAYYNGNPVEDLKKAQANRDAVLKSANQAWSEAVNRPRDAFGDAVQARMDARLGAGNIPASPYQSPNSSKAILNYSSGAAADEASKAKAAASAIEAQRKAYDGLVGSLNSKIKLQQLELSVNEPLSEQQKLAIEINEKVASGQLKLNATQKAHVDGLIQKLGFVERDIELAALRKQSEEAYATTLANTLELQGQETQQLFDVTQALVDKADASDLELQKITMTKEQIDALEVARYNEQIAILEGEKAYLAGQEDREYEIELINKQIDALGRLRDNAGKGDTFRKAEETKQAFFDSMESQAHRVWSIFANEGGQSFKAIGQSLKAYVLDALYQLTLKKFFVNISAGISATASGAALAEGNGVLGTTSWVDTITNGFKSVNTTFASSIENLGKYVSDFGSTGTGFLKDLSSDVGSYMQLNSAQITKGIGYLGAAFQGYNFLKEKNYVGAALTAAGSYWGPLGGLIGGAVGSDFQASHVLDDTISSRTGNASFGVAVSGVDE
jgi:hypothetical protein